MSVHAVMPITARGASRPMIVIHATAVWRRNIGFGDRLAERGTRGAGVGARI